MLCKLKQGCCEFISFLLLGANNESEAFEPPISILFDSINPNDMLIDVYLMYWTIVAVIVSISLEVVDLVSCHVNEPLSVASPRVRVRFDLANRSHLAQVESLSVLVVVANAISLLDNG